MRDVALSPDGLRYLQMAKGAGAPMPFHLRWFLPWVLGEHVGRWRAANAGGWMLFLAAVGVMAGPAWLKAIMLLAPLPGLALAFRLPILIDGAALGITALVAAVDPWYLQVPLALFAGCISERAPIFAALWCWSPIPLVGMLSPLVRYLFWRPGPDVTMLVGTEAGRALSQSWRIGLARNWRDLNLILPWGGVLVGLLYTDVRMLATLSIAYAQLFVATDAVRLYQWAAPVVVLAMADKLDWQVCLMLSAATWFNPWRQDV